MDDVAVDADHVGDPAATAADPGERGALVVHDKVAQRIAERAARATPGVQIHAAGLNKLAGRELPRARVDVSASHVRAHLTIAVTWPQPLAEVGAAVQRNVARALTDSAGFVVDGVDVVVEAITSARHDNPRTLL